MSILVTDNVAVQRFAIALFKTQVGTVTMDQVNRQIDRTSLDATFNSYFKSAFGSMLVADVATSLVANLGITGTGTAAAVSYVSAQLAGADAGARGAKISEILNLFSNLTADATYGAAARAWNANVAIADGYSGAANIAVGGTQLLTSGQDVLNGSALNDSFFADLVNDRNTLQSGDDIEGGAGTDTLEAILEATPFAITPTISGVEVIVITAQNDSNYDSGQNNTSSVDAVQLDFGRVSGVKQIWNNDSRADLVVEDVRLQAGEITKDLTIGMRDTDPGNVDFGVYFDQLSLRNNSSSTSQMNLRVMDTYAAAQGKAELLDSPYGSFTFYYSLDGGTTFTKTSLTSAAIQSAQTFAEMRVALQEAANAALGVGSVTVALGNQYTVPDSVTGNQVTGTEISITAARAISFDTTRAGSGWLATDTVPAISGLYTSFNTASTSTTALVTSTIVLDNVGRGSNGGDLIVGGLSVGDTSTSKGVQRFEITVQDDSKLGTIASTNNSLQEVTLVNGTTDRDQNAYNPYAKDKGNLTVKEFTVNDGNALPDSSGQENDGSGFTDVRLIDGTAMTGKLDFTAQFTTAAVAKYLNLRDIAKPDADNINVIYSGGANNDTMKVDLDSFAVASNSNINVGREDFTFAFNGGAGNDSIDVSIDRPNSFGVAVLEGASTELWYVNQAINDNITINGGAGNDTIRKPGAGDTNIIGGAGDDTVYAENTGRQSVETLNAAGDDGGTTPIAAGMNATWVLNTTATGINLFDLESDARQSVGSYGAELTVVYRGLEASVRLQDQDYKLSDLDINQGMKDAINGDAVLSKLLVAEDGPSGTLIVRSLIDGEHDHAELGFSIARDTTVVSTANVLAAYNAANGTSIADVTTLDTTIGTNLTNIETAYNLDGAEDNNSAPIVGDDSNNHSDNVIEGGEGNDVIVLGTSADSNDTVVYKAAFGDDVIVNFGTSAGADLIDFKALGGKFSGFADETGTVGIAAVGVNGDIIVDDAVAGATGNSTAAFVTTNIVEGITAAKYVYVVAVGNTGTVYQVVDGTGATDLVATLMGTITLADGANGGATDLWLNLSATGTEFA
jgi:hypothetical protein